MTYARSALTHGTALFLIGLLLLFFGGLLLTGGAEPPTYGVGAYGVGTYGVGTYGVGWGAALPGVTSGKVTLFFPGLCLGLGMLLACWARASWRETVAVLVISAGGLWALSPGGLEGLWKVLWQIDWLWREGPAPGPGWSVTLPVAPAARGALVAHRASFAIEADANGTERTLKQGPLHR